MPPEDDSAPSEPTSREDRLHEAMLRLAEEVLDIRMMLMQVIPMGTRSHLAIVAGSAFLGGVVTNLALWFTGAGTILLHR